MPTLLDKNRLKTVRLLFPLHRESLSSYLSPILGQYAIKNTDFITEFVKNFHIQTNNAFKDIITLDSLEAGGSLYDETLFVPVYLNVYKGGKFSMQINKPSLGFLFSNTFRKRRRIYKRWKNYKNELLPLRNYKKLFQIAAFKGGSSNLNELINSYRITRNSLFQTK